MRGILGVMMAFFAMTALAQEQQLKPKPIERDQQVAFEVVSAARRIPDYSVSHADFPDAIPKGCWIRKKTLFGGKQDGVEVVAIHNGKLTIVVVPTRGMSILKVEHADLELSWDSPVNEVVHPKFIDLESRGGLGWLEGFNEWMTRCGLEFAGHPGLDKFTTNTGDKAEMQLTLHGKIGNIPASRAFVVIDRQAPHRIAIRGNVSERMFYGPKLELSTEVSCVPGAESFRIKDEVMNAGAFDQEFQLIYHANYGRPLLGEGAKLIAATKSVTPMNAHAAKAVGRWDTYQGPTRGFVEEVYLLEPLADKSGRTLAVLKNAKGDKATSLRWSTAELPYLTQWKNTADEADGYVTGIEPATGYPFNRRVERQFGRVPKLAPQQTRSFTLDFGIHVGEANVAAVEAETRALQAGQAIDVRQEPPKIEPSN